MSAAPRWVLSMRSWLVLSHLGAFVLPVLLILGTGVWASDLREQTRWDIANQAAILALHLESEWERDGSFAADRVTGMLTRVKEQTLSGIRVTDPTGRVIASSGDAVGEDLSGDPEVAAALEGRSATATRSRDAPSLRQPLSSPSRRAKVRMFVAQPVFAGDAVVATVVISRTPREELQALYQMAGVRLFVGLALALGATAGVAWAASGVLSRGLRRVQTYAGHVAAGEASVAPAASHVAEVTQLGGSVATMSRRLEARLQYINEFASNVSHEFKTPLATLKGTVELLADDDAMPAEQRRRFLDNAERELQRLERLVSGLLSLARADEAPGDEPVDLDAWVPARLARTPQVTVVGPFGRTRGHQAQLDAVLTNLVDNALRHGGDGVRVEVRGVTPAGFAVIDDGRGISPANQQKVFDRFFTTDRVAGTGLGLALVRAIVERHGGTVTLESQPGRTIFRVELPAI